MRYLIFLLSTAAAAQTLTVTILDYADVPPQTLEGAMAVFSTIYQKAGSRVEWSVEKRDWIPEQSTRFADVPGDIVSPAGP